MKRTSKLLALILALTMILSLTITAFAEQSSNNTITIDNAKKGETYKAYKMLELVVDDTGAPKAYTYTVAEKWRNFFSDDNKAVWGTVLEQDAQGYFTAKDGITSETQWNAGSALSIFAEKAAAYAAANDTPVDTKKFEDPATSLVLNTTESGYYLITSTLGTRAMIDTTPGNVVINEKNSEDTIDKEVKEDSTGKYGKTNDAQVGDTVEFKSVVTIVPRSINVKIHDTMGTGLTLNAESIKVYSDEGLTTLYADATVRTGTSADEGDTFTIDIPNTFAATATADQKLYITYTAELNAAAVVKNDSGVAIVDQNNKTLVSFGDNSHSTEATTTTTTHKFTVHKYANEDKEVVLANAIFQLKKGETLVNLVKLDDNNYRVVDDTETTEAVSHVKANQEVETIAANTIVSDFVTVASGDIVIWGVDSDADYKLVEIQAPKGYNLLADAVAVTVDAANSTKAEVSNKSGIELPSTGGMGTTIFYVVGSILLVGAAVLLVTKKRMSAAQ